MSDGTREVKVGRIEARRIAQSKVRRKWREDRLATDPFCDYCGCRLTIESSTVDHILPLHLGGSDDRRNWALACSDCNREKGGKLVREFKRPRGWYTCPEDVPLPKAGEVWVRGRERRTVTGVWRNGSIQKPRGKVWVGWQDQRGEMHKMKFGGWKQWAMYARLVTEGEQP